MGIPTHRFMDRQHEQFVCSICLDVAADPVATNSCDHIFCRACLSNVKQPRCPTCQQKLQNPKFKPIQGSIKRIYIDLKIRCLNSMCDKSLNIGSFSYHDDNCPISFDICRDCNFKSRRGQRDVHSCVQVLKSDLSALTKKINAMESKFEGRIKKLEKEVKENS